MVLNNSVSGCLEIFKSIDDEISIQPSFIQTVNNNNGYSLSADRQACDQ